jgi:hypothetical protein
MEKGSGRETVAGAELDGRYRGGGGAQRQLWLRGRRDRDGPGEPGRRTVCGWGGAAGPGDGRAAAASALLGRGRAVRDRVVGGVEMRRRGKKQGGRNRRLKSLIFGDRVRSHRK